NSPIRSLASARCSSSRARRPCAMILSSRLDSGSALAAGAVDGAGFCSGLLLISSLLHSGPGPAGFLAELLERFGVADDVLEQLLERFVTVHLVEQIGESLAGFQQLAERLDLLGDLFRLEVAELAESEFDVDLRPIVLEDVVRLECKMRFHSGQHLVE